MICSISNPCKKKCLSKTIHLMKSKYLYFGTRNSFNKLKKICEKNVRYKFILQV